MRLPSTRSYRVYTFIQEQAKKDQAKAEFKKLASAPDPNAAKRQEEAKKQEEALKQAQAEVSYDSCHLLICLSFRCDCSSYMFFTPCASFLSKS